MDAGKERKSNCKECEGRCLALHEAAGTDSGSGIKKNVPLLLWRTYKKGGKGKHDSRGVPSAAALSVCVLKYYFGRGSLPLAGCNERRHARHR